ncbi:MAG: hypothetical protein R8L58_00785 [Mariprofundaceae bacterium]
MDTDDLSIMAYRVIVHSARGSDTLKAELGALSRNYKNEDDWLRGALDHLQEIAEDPGAYVDYWNLEEEEGLSATSIQKIAMELNDQLQSILATPLNDRGKREW